jgi:hypothetical protein
MLEQPLGIVINIYRTMINKTKSAGRINYIQAGEKK